MEERGETSDLVLESIIGFGGTVSGGLIVHPNKKQIIYPLGATVVIRDIKDSSKQSFLQGHTNTVSCIAVSKSGKYVASGQITHMGFQASIIIWDFEKKKALHTLTLHKVKVQALAFSPNDLYLASLGGQDDNSVVLWDVKLGQAICGSPSARESAGTALTVSFSNHDDAVFATGGNYSLRVWELDLPNRKIRPTDCQLGQLKRVVRCILVSEDDQFIYCGTTSGDILQVQLKNKLFKNAGPVKEKFSMGVLSLAVGHGKDLIVGAGDGSISIVKRDTLKRIKTIEVDGSVTSLAISSADGESFFAGTSRSNIYSLTYKDMKPELLMTCHYDSINDVAFPTNFSELFATCSSNDIRVWQTNNCQERLRITVPNLVCHTVSFMPDGKSIVSGWNDGKIRAFTPQTGKLLYVIHDAHSNGVTAIAPTHDCSRLISGGGDGQVRVWRITKATQKMEGAMKEHKAAVTCIQIRKSDTECASASNDGSCIIWDLKRFVRNQVMFAATMFKSVAYHPDESQLITIGTDRKIGYWETFDGSLIRDLEASLSGSVNGLAIAHNGDHFVTGGQDKLIKIWKYNEGEVTHIGVGHSGDITQVRISPSQRFIVSVSSDGAIFRWKYPTAPAS
eukprot:Colp12_sorted_trinity150504_noHs@14952